MEYFYLFKNDEGETIAYLHTVNPMRYPNATLVSKEEYLEAGGALTSQPTSVLEESINILLGGKDDELDTIIGY